MTLKKRTSWQITKAVIFALVLREIKGRFGSRRFGAFWMLFEPMAQILIMMAVFSFRGVTVRGGLEFPLFLASGMVPFFLIRNLSLQLMGAVDANRALFAYKQIKPIDTLVARAILEAVLYLIVFVILLFVLGFFFGYPIEMNEPIRWLTVLSLGCVMAFAMGLFFCVISEALPELRSIIRMLFLPLYILSGVLFPIWILPSEIIDWLLWIPHVHIIDELRSAMFTYYPNHQGVNLLYPFKFTAIMLLVSMGLYRIRRHRLVAI